MVAALPKNPQMFLHITGASGGWEVVSWSGRSRAIGDVLGSTAKHQTKSISDAKIRRTSTHRKQSSEIISRVKSEKSSENNGRACGKIEFPKAVRYRNLCTVAQRHTDKHSDVHWKKTWKERDQETQGLKDASAFQQHKTNLEMKSSTGSSIFQTVRQPRTQARQTTRLYQTRGNKEER